LIIGETVGAVGVRRRNIGELFVLYVHCSSANFKVLFQSPLFFEGQQKVLFRQHKVIAA
jgi:hypothetical protein